jgi:GTP cyclohydrolase FolE2
LNVNGKRETKGNTMSRLSKIIDGAEDTRYNLEIAVSVANEAAKYLEKT